MPTRSAGGEEVVSVSTSLGVPVRSNFTENDTFEIVGIVYKFKPPFTRSNKKAPMSESRGRPNNQTRDEPIC